MSARLVLHQRREISVRTRNVLFFSWQDGLRSLCPGQIQLGSRNHQCIQLRRMCSWYVWNLYWSTPTACLACPPGTANNQSGSSTSSDCVACEPGSASALSAAVECTMCSAGYYQPFAGKYSCIACPINTFSQAVQATSDLTCQACPRGTVAPSRSASSSACVGVVCPSGYHGANCAQLCPSGSYCDGDIHPCPSGTFSNLEGSSSCEACAPGRYSTSIGATEEATCRACDLGTFNPHWRSASCKSCPYGLTSNMTGAISQDSCVPCVSIGTTTPSSQDDSFCVGSLPFRIASSRMGPDGAWALASSRAASSIASSPTRAAGSLRLSALTSDPYVQQAESIGSQDPIAPKISYESLISCIVVLLCAASLPPLLYRRLSSRIARRVDLFSLHRRVEDGQPLLKQPSKWEAARLISWAFIPSAILAGLLLGTASNAIVTRALLPALTEFPSSGTIQVTIRAFGRPSNDTLEREKMQCLDISSTSLPLASGLSSAPRTNSD
jgi:hypothetical protein